MTTQDLSDALYQISILSAERENFEVLNTSLISQITKLEKRVTDLHAQLKTTQGENEGWKERCEKYQRAYQELCERLGTYDTHLIEKLETRANRAEAEIRRLRLGLSQSSPDLVLQLQTAIQAKTTAEATVASLQTTLQRSRKESETLVDQLTTEIATSAQLHEAFQTLKERYQTLYRESRQDAVADPIAAPDPLDTPRLPYSSPSLKLTVRKVKSRKELCTLCGQPLPLALQTG